MINLSKIVDYYYSKKKNLFIFDIFNILYVKLYLLFIAIVNVLEWLLARFIYSEIDQERMALHYNVDFGIDYYGDTKKIFVIPFIGLFIAIVNLILFVLVAKHKDRYFISQILFLVTLFSNCILLLSIALIYLVNFS